MATKTATKKKANSITKTKDVKLDKIGVFFRRSTLKGILKILTMEHGGYRSFKAVKNINRLFNNLDMSRYKNNPELESYIWCIKFFSYEWLQGVIDPQYIKILAEHHQEYDPIKGDIISASIDDPNIISAPEAKVLLDLVNESLQYGFITSLRDEYINLLDEINLDQPGAFRELVNRLFLVSSSLLDIKHNTNLVSNKVTFNSSDLDSIRSALGQTIESLNESSNIFKTGITRLNTLLSPGYMNGRLYTYMGLPGGFKSMMLLKTALDFRKYNPGFKPRTPGMRPCVLYITMENSFTETIERIWNMTFDDPITHYTVNQAVDMLCNELGVSMLTNNEDTAYKSPEGNSSLADQLENNDKKNNDNTPNIEIVIKYFSYREISTDDLFTIIQDLRDENMEVCGLVLDYIKRIEPSVPAPDNVKIELGRIINELKALAVIQDIPVITAHQLNRAAAATVDAAVRQGKGDVTKLTGRENTGDAWEVVEGSDNVMILNIEYKPGTNERFLCVQVVKRRRVDASENEMAQYTYLAHPFSKNNPIKLIDDYNSGKILSLKSLASDIDITNKERTNAVPRIKITNEFAISNDDLI